MYEETAQRNAFWGKNQPFFKGITFITTTDDRFDGCILEMQDDHQ